MTDRKVPEPARPLGEPGRAVWDRLWKMGRDWLIPQRDGELLQLVCEQSDERAQLRFQVLSGDRRHRERVALRTLEEQIARNLASLGFGT